MHCCAVIKLVTHPQTFLQDIELIHLALEKVTALWYPKKFRIVLAMSDSITIVLQLVLHFCCQKRTNSFWCTNIACEYTGCLQTIVARQVAGNYISPSMFQRSYLIDLVQTRAPSHLSDALMMVVLNTFLAQLFLVSRLPPSATLYPLKFKFDYAIAMHSNNI